MIIDMRIYRYQPSGFQKFLDLYKTTGYGITSRHLGKTIAIMISTGGLANCTLQLFAYENSEHRDACRINLRTDQEWLEYIRDCGQYIVEQTNIILRPTEFSPLKHYAQLNDPTYLAWDKPSPMNFEKREYVCLPGKLDEALSMLRDQECAFYHSHVERPIGYFTTNSGDLNKITMLWSFTNDAERDYQLEKLYNDDEYRNLKSNFSSLFVRQESSLWGATNYSPLR